MPTMRVATIVIGLAAAAAVVTAAPGSAGAQDAAAATGRFDWPSHNLDLYGSRYAGLDQIDASNAGRLELAWSLAMERDHVITQVTPLVVGGVLYFNDAAGAAFALDAASGERLWTSDFGADSISKRVVRPRGSTRSTAPRSSRSTRRPAGRTRRSATAGGSTSWRRRCTTSIPTPIRRTSTRQRWVTR